MVNDPMPFVISDFDINPQNALLLNTNSLKIPYINASDKMMVYISSTSDLSLPFYMSNKYALIHLEHRLMIDKSTFSSARNISL